MEIDGNEVSILGVRARHEPGEQTPICLPTFKDAGGSWQPAIRLPQEVRALPR